MARTKQTMRKSTGGKAPRSPSTKRQKAEGGASDKNVFLVIHEGVPQDTGSNYNYSDTLPETQDTQIIGIFTSYSKAVLAAEDYAESMGWLEEVEEEEVVELGKEMWREQLQDIDWCSEGFYRDEQDDDNAPDDRLHIVK